MKITPTKLTVNQLFSGKNEQFCIPAYQRRYSWKRRHVRELFDDLYYLSEGETHLLGTILCLTEDHVAGINHLEVVDGQQRITTLALLLYAFQDRFRGMGRTDEVSELELLMRARGQDGTKDDKVLLGDLDRPDFRKVLEDKDSEEIQNKDLLEAFRFLKKLIHGLKDREVHSLYAKLCNNTIVVRLDIGHAKDAYKLFETINNRGLELSETDIIKNFLLGHASLLSDVVLDSVRNSWQKVILSLDGPDPDEFFRHLIASRLRRKITGSKVIEEFKKHYLTQVIDGHKLPDYQRFGLGTAHKDRSQLDPPDQVQIQEFAEAVAHSAKIYGMIWKQEHSSPTVNQHLLNLSRIRAVPTFVFLLALFERDLPEAVLCRVLATLETFVLRRHVCAYRTGEMDEIFAKLCRLPNEELPERVKEELTPHTPPDTDFEEKFPTHDFRGLAIPRARYVLEQMEYLEHGQTGEFLVGAAKNVHVEHIIPQKVTTKKAQSEFGDWVSYLGEDELARHDAEANTIGNLTLLAAPLNISASNNPFQTKREAYRKSAIQITKKIAEEYDDFRFDQARERGERLAEKAVSLWSF